MSGTFSKPDGYVLDLENDWESPSVLRAVKRGSLVFLVGSLDGTNQSDLEIATLPEGYRPTEEISDGVVTIGTDGVITSVEEEPAEVYLSGIQFWVGSV